MAVIQIVGDDHFTLTMSFFYNRGIAGFGHADISNMPATMVVIGQPEAKVTAACSC